MSNDFSNDRCEALHATGHAISEALAAITSEHEPALEATGLDNPVRAVLLLVIQETVCALYKYNTICDFSDEDACDEMLVGFIEDVARPAAKKDKLVQSVFAYNRQLTNIVNTIDDAAEASKALNDVMDTATAHIEEVLAARAASKTTH